MTNAGFVLELWKSSRGLSVNDKRHSRTPSVLTINFGLPTHGVCLGLKLTNAFGVVNEKQWLLNSIGTARRIQSHTFSGMREIHLGMSYGDGVVLDAIYNFGLG